MHRSARARRYLRKPWLPAALLPPRPAPQASCTSKVERDMAATLGLQQPRIVRASFNRPNIAYQVRGMYVWAHAVVSAAHCVAKL